MGMLDGKVAIVTGAGSGIGRGEAVMLADHGAKVVVNDLGGNGTPADNAVGVVEEIRAAGGTAIADPADVADFDQVSAMAARAERTWGRVDILVNNAGVLRDKTFAKMEMADFEFVVRVHLIGSANCTKAVWAGMRERAYGRIVLTSSASGGLASPARAKLVPQRFVNQFTIARVGNQHVSTPVIRFA